VRCLVLPAPDRACEEAAYLATTRTGRSYVVATQAENRSHPLPETAAPSMLAAVRAAFTLAARG
jgi:hypothetical protein